MALFYSIPVITLDAIKMEGDIVYFRLIGHDLQF